MTEPDLEHERQEAARLLLNDPRFASMLTGDSVAEIVKSAAEIAKALREHHDEQEAAKISFDGGCRPPPEPPAPSHEQTLIEMFRGTRTGDGSGWGRR